MRFLTAEELDDLADEAAAFEVELLAAYEESGHGWRSELGGEDRICPLCEEASPCPAYTAVMAAVVAIRDALVGLGVWREVLCDREARHSPSVTPP